MEFFRIKGNIGPVRAVHERIIPKAIVIAYEEEDGAIKPIHASRVLFKRSTESGQCKLWVVNLLEEHSDDAEITHITLLPGRCALLLAE